MTDIQRAFCHEYLRDKNGTAAAIRAGYSEKSARSKASQLLKNKEIDQLLKELVKKAESACVADLQEVLEFFTSVMRDRKAPLKIRLRAAELLGRWLGMFDASTGNDYSGQLDALIKAVGQVA